MFLNALSSNGYIIGAGFDKMEILNGIHCLLSDHPAGREESNNLTIYCIYKVAE